MLMLFYVSTSSAAIRRVGATDSCQTIACAYTVANSGDTILISSGTYNENLTSTKRLTILGSGLDLTTINGQIVFNAGASNSVLEGMSVVHSQIQVHIAGAVDSLVLRRCRFSNTGVDWGGVNRTAATTARLFIDDCLFTGNPNISSPYGFVSMNGDNAIVRNCIFAETCWCRDGGAFRGLASSLTVQNCTFVGFVGRLLDLTGSFPFLFTNNVIYDFQASWGTYPPNSTLDYNASTGTAPAGALHHVTLTSNPFVTYTTHAYVFGTSNLHLNGTAGGGAACVDAGVPSIHDLDGSTSDLGIYGGQTPYIDSGAPAYPYTGSLTVPPAITVGQQLQIQSQGRIGRGY
jgi:hypothetical protein